MYLTNLCHHLIHFNQSLFYGCKRFMQFNFMHTLVYVVNISMLWRHSQLLKLENIPLNLFHKLFTRLICQKYIKENISVLLKLPRRRLKQHKQHKMTNPNLFYNNSGSEFAGKDTQTESETKHGQNVPIKNIFWSIVLLHLMNGNSDTFPGVITTNAQVHITAFFNCVRPVNV